VAAVVMLSPQAGRSLESFGRLASRAGRSGSATERSRSCRT
jgi:hypothetical protein